MKNKLRKKLYILMDKPNKNEEIYYIEIIYEYQKYKKYKQTIYLETKTKEISENKIYLIKYNKQNIKEEKIIYIILNKDEVDESNQNKIIESKQDETVRFKHPPKITYFRFFEFKTHNHLSSFDAGTMYQRPNNNIAQKQFFNTMQRRYGAFKLFSYYSKLRDIKRKCLILWSKK